jgi:hypothetical protein
MKKNDLNKIKSTGFKAPKGYFDEISDRVMNRVHDGNEMELPSSDGFKVPANYFEGLENHILYKVKEDKVSRVLPLNSNKKWFYLTGVAAAIAILLTLVIPVKISEPAITLDMVESHFAYNGLDSYELAELLVETELLDIEDLSIQPTYDDNELEAYLLDNANLEEIILEKQ